MGEWLADLNPLSHRCAMPAPPKGELFDVFRSAQIKLPFRGSWQSLQALPERVTIRPQQPTVRPHQSPAVTASPDRGKPFGTANFAFTRKPCRHAKGSPFGRAAEQGEAERASPLKLKRQQKSTAHSRARGCGAPVLSVTSRCGSRRGYSSASSSCRRTSPRCRTQPPSPARS